MTQDQLKHLDYVQSAITRMANNQFQIKGWTITLNTAILTIFANSIINGKGINAYFLLMAIFPTTLFWIMDSKFLSQERRLRRIYMDVAENSDKIKLFEIPMSAYSGRKYSTWNCMFSFSNVLVYMISSIIFLGAFVCVVFL